MWKSNDALMGIIIGVGLIFVPLALGIALVEAWRWIGLSLSQAGLATAVVAIIGGGVLWRRYASRH